ncbi:MAG: amidohydrolase family protein [Gammaproteobacteria bacterium]|nr:amidohydrolase family protein [Gammaproteobacteria bacterium]
MNKCTPAIYRYFLTVIGVLGLISCSSINTVDHTKFRPLPVTVLVTNTNLLSENGDSIIANQNILIRNGVIEEISSTPIRADLALKVDGRNRYLIPGLIDSHVHLQESENDLLVYLAHGITSVREMSGNDDHIEWREEIRNGRAGPSIEISSEKISSKSGLWGFINEVFWHRINVSSESQAIDLIEDLKADGYDNVKIASDINKPMYLAVTKAANQQGLRIVGHIPSSISFEDFINSGQKEIAHIEEIVKTLNIEFGYFTTSTGDSFLNFVTRRSDEIASVLKKQQIAVGTTLWYMQSIPEQVTNLNGLIEQLDLSYTNPVRVKQWMPESNEFSNNHAHLNNWWPIFVKANEIVLTALIKHDVIILAGTDSMASLVVPGLSMHQELEALVNSGMSPQQALKSATSIPANWMSKRTGKIAVGYSADLVLLNENPLTNISATKDIRGVMHQGRYYDHNLLNKMLDNIKKAYHE